MRRQNTDCPRSHKNFLRWSRNLSRRTRQFRTPNELVAELVNKWCAKSNDEDKRNASTARHNADMSDKHIKRTSKPSVPMVLLSDIIDCRTSSVLAWPPYATCDRKLNTCATQKGTNTRETSTSKELKCLLLLVLHHNHTLSRTQRVGQDADVRTDPTNQEYQPLLLFLYQTEVTNTSVQPGQPISPALAVPQL